MLIRDLKKNLLKRKAIRVCFVDFRLGFLSLVSYTSSSWLWLTHNVFQRVKINLHIFINYKRRKNRKNFTGVNSKILQCKHFMNRAK